ncbi:MAG: cell division topological specificity factor MinE [Alphaproteobacteria bacterium]
MNLFKRLRRRGSAPVARDRLQVLLAHERATGSDTDLIAILREEILKVIERHVPVEPENVAVKMTRGDTVSILEVDIEIPAGAEKLAQAS